MNLIVILIITLLIGIGIGYNLNNKPKQPTVVNKIEYVENTKKIDSLEKKATELKYQLQKQKDKLPDISDKEKLKGKSREYLVDSVITPMELIQTKCLDIVQTQDIQINYLEQNNQILVEENKELRQEVRKEKILKWVFIGTTVIITVISLI